MKSKQKPTAAAAGSLSARPQQQRSSRGEDDSTRNWQRRDAAQPTQCERERKHEAARKEREAQAQLRRKSTVTPIRDRARQQQQQHQQQQNQSKSSSNTAAATVGAAASATVAASGSATGSSDSVDEAAQLRLQLEHLAQLSEHDFEREFRKWMAQEGVEGKIQSHLRKELMQSFHKTALGQLLRKASTASASAVPLTATQSNCLLLSPMTQALHTLVAEFLYVHNCHYTLSVFCSETPHRHTLPDFEERKEFRFTSDELQQVLQVMLGEQPPQQQLKPHVMRLYDEQQQDSLLLDCFKALAVPPSVATDCTQTAATLCLQVHSDLDTSRLFQAEREQLLVAGEARTLYVGPRLSQSLYGVEQQLGQLMRHMRDLCRSCAPPVEIISQPAFEQLLQQELSERQRLETPLPAGQMATKLPEQYQPQAQAQTQSQSQLHSQSTSLPGATALQLPTDGLSAVPKLPHLHAEQVASLAMVQQALQQFQQQQMPHSVEAALERMELFVGELAGCIQTLSNVLNLAMEQEYAVGRHKGFKLGYREGFAHGHFMGMQEGEQQQQMERMQQQEKMQQERVQLHSTSSQTSQKPAPVKQRSVISQTQLTRRRHRGTSMDPPQSAQLKDAACQTAPEPEPPPRSYEQWIYEMLHTRSGQIFLERVELSLNKALDLQKQRLDELYNIKLRHHAELLRLSRRQNSWRALCRHVEKESHSLEARELVQKIFRLLEHYEAHHRQLAEKIQQTEQAAAHATRIQPVWTDDSVVPLTPEAPPCPMTPISSTSFTTDSLHRAAATAFVAPPTAPPPARPYSSRSAAVPPAPVPAAVAPPVAVAVPAPVPVPAPTVSFQLPAPHPPKPLMHHVATNTVQLSPEPPLRVQPPPPAPPPAPSFNEALLSAKSRMLQLEQESALLEQSFLSYLERERAQKQRHNVRARERLQFQSTMDSLRDWKKSSEEQQQQQQQAPTAAGGGAGGGGGGGDAELELELELQLDAEPDSYKFTNAIAEARHKLLSKLQTPVQTQIQAQSQLAPSKLIELDQVQSETQLLLHRVEATLARVSKPPSLQLQLEMEMDPLSAGTLETSPEQLGDGIASRKLQRSMAKMQQLFGYQEEQKQQQQQLQSKPKQKHLSTAALRPWSAPISKLRASFLHSARPHTAPSSLTDIVKLPAVAPTNFLGLLDALSDGSDTTANSSSLTSLDKHLTPGVGEVYSQLLGQAGVPTPSPSSDTGTSSPTLSHSQEFWRRMNL